MATMLCPHDAAIWNRGLHRHKARRFRLPCLPVTEWGNPVDQPACPDHVISESPIYTLQSQETRQWQPHIRQPCTGIPPSGMPNFYGRSPAQFFQRNCSCRETTSPTMMRVGACTSREAMSCGMVASVAVCTFWRGVVPCSIRAMGVSGLRP
jgi:hypothetical protein